MYSNHCTGSPLAKGYCNYVPNKNVTMFLTTHKHQANAALEACI